jgi:16S rRNA (cytosine967-C5)-methyltransferase
MAVWGTGRVEKILSANQEFSWPDLLVNERKISVADAEQLLRERGVPVERSPISPRALRLRESTKKIAQEIRDGLLYPMDEASIAVASLLGGGPALDLAAAPGGKSLVLRLRGADVVSHDISLRRLLPLRDSYGRFFERPPLLAIGDGAVPAFRYGRFNSVLLDAPCSATGIIRKNPEIRWRLRAEDIAEFAATQRRILSGALSLGAREVLYATCSLEKEENDSVCDVAVDLGYRRVDLREVAPAELLPWIDDGVLRLTPESGADGFTASLLRHS